MPTLTLVLALGFTAMFVPQVVKPRVEQMPATYKALYCHAHYQLWVWREDTAAAPDSVVCWHWFKEENGYPEETAADGIAMCLRRGVDPPKRSTVK